MKTLLLTLILLISSLQVNAETPHQCVLMYLIPLKQITEKKVGPDGADDKLKHCALSCMLSIHCPTPEVAVVGITKEIVDIFGPGNAEYADLQADYKGIEIYITNKVQKYDDCVRLCEVSYPKRNKCLLEQF